MVGVRDLASQVWKTTVAGVKDRGERVRVVIVQRASAVRAPGVQAAVVLAWREGAGRPATM